MPGIGPVQYGIVKFALTSPLLGPIGPYIANMVNKEFANDEKSAAIVEISLVPRLVSYDELDCTLEINSSVIPETGLPMHVSGWWRCG